MQTTTLRDYTVRSSDQFALEKRPGVTRNTAFTPAPVSTLFASKPPDPYYTRDIMFQLGSTQSNGSFQQPAPAMNYKNTTMGAPMVCATGFSAAPVAVVTPPVLGAASNKTSGYVPKGGEQSGMTQAEMDLMTENMFKETFPDYYMWSHDYSYAKVGARTMTEQEYSDACHQFELDAKSAIVATGTDPAAADIFIRQKFENLGTNDGGWQNIYDPYTGNKVDPVVYQQALSRAEFMWSQTEHVEYVYSPINDAIGVGVTKQEMIPAVPGAPADYAQIVEALIVEGFERSVAEQATHEAKEKMDAQWLTTLDQGKEKQQNDEQKLKSAWDMAVDACVEMLRNGAKAQDLNSYLLSEGWTDETTRYNIMEESIKKYNWEVYDEGGDSYVPIPDKGFTTTQTLAYAKGALISTVAVLACGLLGFDLGFGIGALAGAGVTIATSNGTAYSNATFF